MKKYLDRKYYPQIIILENKRLKNSVIVKGSSKINKNVQEWR